MAETGQVFHSSQQPDPLLSPKKRVNSVLIREGM